MIQDWGKLLFMHWPVDPALLRPLVPAGLEIDTFDGAAYVGIVPFTMWGIRPPFLPPLPGLSRMHEINVRTYVKCNGEPGVSFFSLDATKRIGVWGARRFWRLPYYRARITLEQNRAGKILYTSQRIHEGAVPATFHAIWKPGERLAESAPTSLAYFLTERYQLFVEHDGGIYRTRIHHPRWPLQSASLEDFRSSMLEAAGLPEGRGEPLLHYAEHLRVKVSLLREFPEAP